MKLLCCVTCNEIFNLSYKYKECEGGHGGGQYIDNLNAKVWGPKDKIFVLGYANSSFVGALREQLTNGDSKEMFGYGGKITPKGREFTAFVIPDAADSVERVNAKFSPIDVDWT